MTVKLIAAVDGDNAIGWADGSLPWKIPDDMKRFKGLTTGKSVVMGRKTFDSLKMPAGLPNRKNVVVTREKKDRYDFDSNPFFFHDMKTWVEESQKCLGCEPGDVWIIGGAEIYKLALEWKLVEEIYLTTVGVNSGADVKFPYDLSNLEFFNKSQEHLGVKWTLTNFEEHLDQPVPFSFITLKRD